MLSTLSTMVIDPPEGDMAEYERQLARLAALGLRALYPAHGPPAATAGRRCGPTWPTGPSARRGSSTALREPGTLAEVTARAYADVPPRSGRWPSAAAWRCC